MTIYVAPLPLPTEAVRYRAVLQRHLDNMVELANSWKWGHTNASVNLKKIPTRMGLRKYIDHEFNLARQFVKDENITLEKLGTVAYIYVTDKHPNAHYLYNGRACKMARASNPVVSDIRTSGSLMQLWSKGWVDDSPPDRYIPHPSRPLGMIAPEVPDPISPLLVEFVSFGYQLEDSIQFTVRSRFMPQKYSQRELRRLRKIYHMP